VVYSGLKCGTRDAVPWIIAVEDVVIGEARAFSGRGSQLSSDQRVRCGARVYKLLRGDGRAT
jgi:hypothetical protein